MTAHHTTSGKPAQRTLWDFHGGIHPPQNKTQSTQRPIQPLPLAQHLIVPLQQHIGAPPQVQVAAGDQVLKGQLLASAAGERSLPVHAPTSGRVLGIVQHPVPHPSGLTDWCVSLEADGLDQWVHLTPCEDYTQLDRDALRARIRQAGIAGLGGAGFPTHIKLTPPREDKVRTLILNGAECEPYITADDMLMRERADEIVGGLAIMAYILSPGEVLIGIEDNKPEAIRALQAAVSGTGIQVVVIPTKYPSGGERQLIKILTGLEVPSGHIPADIGVMCQNVGTAAAVYRAIRWGEPLISRIVTVTGDGVAQPGNFEVLLGTPIQHLLAAAGLRPAKNRRLIMGGAMMGFTLPSSQVPVIKTTNCIIAAGADEILPNPTQPHQACIRCGLCVDVCPAQLLPQQLYWFSRAQELPKAEAHHLFDCIECGACAYVCPSKIPLVQYYRHAKGEIREQRAETIQSDRARERFAARNQRLAREEAEKQAKRAARTQAVKAQTAAETTMAETATTPHPEKPAHAPDA